MELGETQRAVGCMRPKAGSRSTEQESGGRRLLSKSAGNHAGHGVMLIAQQTANNQVGIRGSLVHSVDRYGSQVPP